MRHPKFTTRGLGWEFNDALKSRKRFVVIPEFYVGAPEIVVILPSIRADLNRFLISLYGFVLLY
jgi:hypothetical protein